RMARSPCEGAGKALALGHPFSFSEDTTMKRTLFVARAALWTFAAFSVLGCSLTATETKVHARSGAASGTGGGAGGHGGGTDPKESPGSKRWGSDGSLGLEQDSSLNAAAASLP